MSSLDAILEPVVSSDEVDPRQILALVCAKIAPLWPLENFVAVNPYHHFADHSLEGVADRMAKVAGARTAMPITDSATSTLLLATSLPLLTSPSSA